MRKLIALLIALVAIGGCAEPPAPPASVLTTPTPQPQTIWAWDRPGGTATTAVVEQTPPLLARCAAYPELIQVRLVGGSAVWVRIAELGESASNSLPLLPWASLAGCRP